MQRVEGDFTLGLADGTETFRGLGSDKEEVPQKDEVICFDSHSKNVMCRRWNWRNSDVTKIKGMTQQLVINIDCLPPQSPELAIQARDELAGLLRDHCDAKLYTGALHSQYREMVLG